MKWSFSVLCKKLAVRFVPIAVAGATTFLDKWDAANPTEKVKATASAIVVWVVLETLRNSLKFFVGKGV